MPGTVWEHAAAHFNEYGEKAANTQETVKEHGRTEKQTET
jgi:hypothetical protein